MKKKLIIIFLILIVFISLIYFSGIYKLLFVLIRNANIDRKASYYEDVEVRLDYYYDNKSDLENILDFFNDNKTIESIDRYSICSSRLNEYEFKYNYILCTNEKLSEDVVKSIEESIIEKIYNMKLEKIKLIKSDEGTPIEYSFRLISTPSYRVEYGYCLEPNECNTESKYEELSSDGYDGVKIKNKIDDNWYTLYYDIPPL